MNTSHLNVVAFDGSDTASRIAGGLACPIKDPGLRLLRRSVPL